MSADRTAFGHRIGLLLVISLLAGLIVAGIALPVVGGLGLIARTSADSFNNLPSELVIPPLPQRSRILAADGSVIATFYYQNRVVVPLTEIAPVMRLAIVGIEDSRFYEHHGFDLQGTVRALVNDARGQSVQGGSTITQQYVKNVLVESAQDASGRAAARAQTVGRKIRELKYSLALEERLSKDEILNRYLNIAYFSEGAYGVESAARRYFSTTAAKLTLPQAAMIAGIVKSPGAYDPIAHPKATLERRNVVLDRMRELGYITEPEYRHAVATKLGLKLSAVENGCEASDAPFFCDYVLKRFQADPALGGTAADRTKLLLRGGLDIRTTLDPKAQAAAQHAVDSRVPRTSSFGAAIAMVEPGTGNVLALAENRDFGSPDAKSKNRHTHVNYATDQAYGGSSGFPSGSTFKVFTLAAALQEGLPLGLRINSPSVATVSGFHNCSTGVPYPPYTLHNAGDSESGNFDMTAGTVESVNTYYVQLEQRVSQCKVADMATSLGVRKATGEPLKPDAGPALTLGVYNVSPLDMATAYAAFAAHGQYCSATVITSVTDAAGQQHRVTPGECRQVLPAGIADTVSSVLRQVIDGPDPHRTGIGASIGRPAAGKTGTVQDFAAAWFCGYTPQLAAAVWVGDPSGGFSHQLRRVTIGGQYFPQVYGGSLPAPLWADAMRGALEGTPPEDFPPADPEVVAGKQIAIPDLAGLTPPEALQQLGSAGLRGVLGGQVPSYAAQGLVAYTYPAAGVQVNPGTTITVYVSNGQPPPPSPTASAGATPTTGPTPGGTPSAGTPTPSTTPTTAPPPKRRKP